MEWEQFKKLSKELKEEYMFKFHGKEMTLNAMPILAMIVALAGIVATGAFTFYLILKDPIFDETTHEAAKLIFSQLGYIVELGSYIILGMFVWNVGVLIVRVWKEARWKRKNKIKTVPEWISKMLGTKR